VLELEDVLDDDELEPELDADELDEDFESLPHATRSASTPSHHSLFIITLDHGEPEQKDLGPIVTSSTGGTKDPGSLSRSRG
jgi:hypothetical protein